MKTWKYFLKVVDKTSGFKSEYSYNDLRVALECFCNFLDIDCDIVQLYSEKGDLIEYVK